MLSTTLPPKAKIANPGIEFRGNLEPKKPCTLRAPYHEILKYVTRQENGDPFSIGEVSDYKDSARDPCL